MSRINRRALLLGPAGVAIAPAFATAFSTESSSAGQPPSSELCALIRAHKAAYAAFGTAMHALGGPYDDQRASRAEEMALLAICAYPAASEVDRRAKAVYLLEVESRGELDLAEHVQALLKSIMWKA